VIGVSSGSIFLAFVLTFVLLLLLVFALAGTVFPIALVLIGAFLLIPSSFHLKLTLPLALE
jgi:hypothetical protein